MVLRHFIFSISTILFITACSSDPPISEESSAAPEAAPTEAAQRPTDSSAWGYTGDKGPEQWSSLSPEFSLCGQGRSQSPINLVWKKPQKGGPRVDYNYTESTATVENTGSTAKIKLSGNNQMLINGQAYNLEMIDFHSPSEHQLSGTPLSLEIQMHHKSMNGDKVAVVSLFAIEGRENALLREVLGQLQGGSGFQLNASKLLPPRKSFYHYMGSMTTPPCSEGVEWLIYNTPMELSREQIMAFRTLFPQNNRPVQPVNGRKIQNY